MCMETFLCNLLLPISSHFLFYKESQITLIFKTVADIDFKIFVVRFKEKKITLRRILKIKRLLVYGDSFDLTVDKNKMAIA